MKVSLSGEIAYDMEKVRVKVLKNTPEIRAGGEAIGPLFKDQEVEVERWIARILKEEGYVEILDDKSIDLTTLSKIAWRENRSSQLTPLEPSFYAKARAYLKSLSEKAKEKPEVLSEKKIAESRLIDIINCRVQKIVSLALAGAQPPRDVLSNLTPEEKLLLNELNSIILRWKQEVKGEDIG